MDENKSPSMSDSADSAAKGTVRIGAAAAQTAKTLTKASAKAASGNFAGAAVDVVKNPESLKVFVAVILVFALFLVMICTLFLYALPTEMFEVITEFFAQIKNGFLEHLYSSEYGSIPASVVPAFLASTKDALVDLAQSAWSSFKNIFSSSSYKDSSSTYAADSDKFTSAADEFQVTFVEDSQKETLWNKIDATKQKLQYRMEEAGEAIVKSRQIQDAVYNVWWNDDDYVSSEEDTDYGKKIIQCKYGGCTVNYYASSISDMNAARLLCIYTAMAEGSLQDMRLYDYLKWLGYAPGYLFPSARRNSAVVSQNGFSVSIPLWKGTCIPQYMYEQKEIEEHLYGAPLVDYESTYGAAVADILMVIDLPDVSGIKPQVSWEKKESDYYEWEYPTQTEINNALANGDPTPQPEYVKKKKIVWTQTCTYSVGFSINLRSPEMLIELLGITGVEEEVDEEAEDIVDAVA